MDNNSINVLRCKLLSKKISDEYVISCANYENRNDEIAIIINAYNQANDLFNVDSSTSIVQKTIYFYLEHINEAINLLFNSSDELAAFSQLLNAYCKVQVLLSEGSNPFEEKLCSEITRNKGYYRLFSLDYYLEKARIYGIDSALSELEEDINIRAKTYYDAAYNEFIEILPGLNHLLDSITNK